MVSEPLATPLPWTPRVASEAPAPTSRSVRPTSLTELPTQICGCMGCDRHDHHSGRVLVETMHVPRVSPPSHHTKTSNTLRHRDCLLVRLFCRVPYRLSPAPHPLSLAHHRARLPCPFEQFDTLKLRVCRTSVQYSRAPQSSTSFLR